MDTLRELYQEIIIDHGRRPRNFGAPKDYTHALKGYNPLCGDQLTLFLTWQGNHIEQAQFEGQGCAISMASASLMTEALRGKTAIEAEKLFQTFHEFVTQSGLTAEDSLGKLAILGGVREYPTRIKCATLAWHTLASLLKGQQNEVSTEV